MISLQLDMREFELVARAMGAALDQVPFALATAMNEAVKVARVHEVETVWPAHVTVRNRGFIRAALRTEFASKKQLRVAVFDALGRGHLKLHDKGGTKQAKGRLAIPDRKVRRTGKGVSAKQRPSALPNSFRKGDIIYQRYGRKGSKLRLMYTLQPNAPIKADVPFHAEFAKVMTREMSSRFGAAMTKAMRTRR